MGKIKRIKVKSLKKFAHPVTGPGIIQIHESSLPPRITIHSYNAGEYQVFEVTKYSEIADHLKKFSTLSHWINIRGLGDYELFNYLDVSLNIHRLILEDIINTRQRPKLDEAEGYLFAVSRTLYLNSEQEIENEQISFILMPNVVISFQENYTESFNPLIHRLKDQKGNIRKLGASYMLYALMDLVVDQYFELINRLGDELETMEELLYRRPEKSMMYDIQGIKKAMTTIRRAIWPERDKINEILRSDSVLINQGTKTFFRDTYDHTMQIIDLVESYRDITTGLIDMNLSFMSNRMNEIMKVLTIISSIFIPLTFIAGIYGMNFAYQDPKTGEILRNNMPELYAENGYLYTMAVMLLIFILQLIYFWRKGWLSSK